MAKKDKYHVLEKKSGSLWMFLKALVNGAKLSAQVEIGSLSENQAILNFLKSSKDIVFALEADCHKMYENCKDLKNIEREELLKYLKSKKISVDKFKENYDRKISQSVRYIGLFAVLENKGVKAEDFVGFLIEKGIKNEQEGIEDFDIFEDVSEFLDEKSEKYLRGLFENDDFNHKEIDEELMKIIDDYHTHYMNEKILTEVTSDIQNKMVLDNAKRISKRKVS